MVTDKRGKIFEDRRKVKHDIKRDRRKSSNQAIKVQNKG